MQLQQLALNKTYEAKLEEATSIFFFFLQNTIGKCIAYNSRM